jgi:hypothetical protein
MAQHTTKGHAAWPPDDLVIADAFASNVRGGCPRAREKSEKREEKRLDGQRERRRNAVVIPPAL